MCGGTDKDDLALNQSFVVAAAANKKSKGQMFLSHDMAGMTFGAAIAYDSGYTSADTFLMNMKVKFGGDMGGSEVSFGQYLNMKVVEDGVSFIQASDAGNFMGSTMQNAGAARFDDENGQVYYALNTTNEGTDYNTSTQACVDSAGVVVECSGAKFEDGGDLYIEAEEVPGFLPDDFEATAPSGFDCNDATWTEVELDMADTSTQEAHMSCLEEQSEMFEEEDCWDAAYAPSEATFELPERDEVPVEVTPIDELE
jgi:hypothetical protein